MRRISVCGQLRGLASLRKSAISSPLAYHSALRCADQRRVAGFGGGSSATAPVMCSLSSAVSWLPAALTVVGLDRVADVDLVGEQPRLRRRQVRQVVREADDRQAGPGDVVLPELAHGVMEGGLLGFVTSPNAIGAVAVTGVGRAVVCAGDA